MLTQIATALTGLEDKLAGLFGNIKLVEKGMMGLEGSYVELLTILGLGLLAVLPALVPPRHRQRWRNLNQFFGVVIYMYHNDLGAFRSGF